jgi:uncharacterized membrane protein
MKLRKFEAINLLIVLISLGLAIYFYSKMPSLIATHWNYRGEVDGFMSKFWGLFLTPIIMFGLWVTYLVVPKIDPLKDNVEKFRKYFDRFILLFFIFLLTIQIFIILWQQGIKIKPNFLFPVSMGVLFYYIGIMMEKSKRNWFIGFRTPWTLSSDVVWEKTHKVGGKLFKLVGLFAIIGSLFPNYAFLFVISPVIIVVLLLTIYSYWEYKKI